MDAFAHLKGDAPLPAALHGGVVAIGNFDGIHRGHQAVLDCARAEADALGAPAMVLTFEPHPRKVFRPEVPLFVLTPPAIKSRLLAQLGFSAMVEQPFSREFAGQSPESFITSVLVERLGMRHVVTGFDFHFGKDRQGGPAFLMRSGEEHGFGVSLVDAFRDENTEIVSSSRIRALLGDGDVAQAAGLLGYHYTVEAKVIGGQQLGRTLGFPTANMRLAADNGLREGVYAVRFRRADGSLHDGVASFGRRPTVEEDGVPLLETYVFDFSGNLYGEIASVSFFGWIRGEWKFDGLDPMVARIRQDEEEARALLSGVRPISALDAAICF